MGDNSNGQKLSLAWLDDSVNEENAVNQQQLRLIDNNLKILKNKTECNEYLNSQPDDARITLIVNGRLGKEVVPDIKESPKIIAIHVFCMNKEAHLKWASTIDKVKGVYIDINELKKALHPNPITPDVHKSIVNPVPTTDTPPSVDPPPTTTIEITSSYDVDCSYMISDSCFDLITKMKMLPAEKSDYISLCEDALKGNDALLSLIHEFQKDYSADRALSWLNRDPFFYGFIDNIFKIAWFTAVFPCRVFIRDIYKQLEQHKCKSTIELYQCDLMTNENFQKLKASNGKVIAIKSFFLVNSDRKTVESYLANYGQSNEKKRILYIIDANPQIENVKPFAKIGSLSNYNDPNDVIFMIGSLFKINEIQDEKDGIINIKMSLCANDDEKKLKSFFEQLKAAHIDSNGETDAIRFGQFLSSMGHQINSMDMCDTGENIIRSCLQKLPSNDPEAARCHDALGDIHLYKNDLDSSLDSYLKAMEIKKQKSQTNTPEMSESYKNIALVYFKKEDFAKASEYFKLLLALWKQLYSDENPCLSLCYTHMAQIHEKNELIPEALSYYYQALAIMVKHSSDEDPALAAVYHNLGNIHSYFQQYHLSLGYFHRALEMKLKSPTSDKSCIALTYKNIGVIYRDMGNVPQAQENLKRSGEIYREIHPLDNPLVIEIDELIKKL